ncbi:T9SS C-terminal target domain-containing protein [candidate division KSB1 bacterium]|nr:T9SS type A sorting domain-containing protein [candidate division KSB1 bacterium]RQW07200.1 MAG: T9SS C-terminal target domain-containing protein [candidate division KSB1 bacterium]
MRKTCNNCQKIGLIFIILALLAGDFALAQIGDLIWEENFDSLDNWNKSTGNGSWGWGNGELQFYKEDNVQISAIPGEPGNNALHITAREETGPDIVDQWGNPLNYTSGRINTKAKVSVQYGLIEARVRVPDLNLGGWPAVWLQGTSNVGWPKNGELDMMEMGQSKSFRDLHDSHNGGNGQNNSTVNQVTGANAIWFSQAAVNPDNPSGAASIAWDANYCRPYYSYDPPLNNRFVIYRMYWDDKSIRFTVIDNEIEHDLYTGAFPISSDSDEFRQPFFFITNLAIGGTFTDACNLGDPGSGEPVSMPFPADMYVDYIRVYEWNGKGEMTFGGQAPESESYGLFTDTTPTNSSLQVGQTAEIYVWEGTLTGGSIPPFEGEHGISWKTTGKGWFGAGIMANQPVDMSGLGDGYLKFMIKMPAHVTFQIGINDTGGNESYVDFPANTTKFGLMRDGEWGQASIPIRAIRGTKVDLRTISYPFTILETNGASCEFALDDIYWDNRATGVHEKYAELNKTPENFSLQQNFPNPFNPQTTITYSLPRTTHVKLEVYDINGKLVYTLVSEIQSAGTFAAEWDAQDLASGIYFYKLTAGNFSHMRKMMLIR